MPRPPARPPMLARRYEAIALLGGTTWIGRDRSGALDVVIRSFDLAALSEPARMCAEHQVSLLEGLPSSSRVRLLHAEKRGSTLFVVLTHVAGPTLRDVLTRDGPLEIPRVLELADGLLNSLAELHASGILHLDLKPDNIVLTEDGSVALIDFGFSMPLTVGARAVGGTAAYMSPEQAGLLRRDVGPRADLYSAGIVLFELLRGRPPFQGATASDVLRQHITLRVPAIERPGAEALGEIIHRLLRKDPRERYASAADVWAEIDALRSGEAARTASGPRRWLIEPAFTGRRRELNDLMEALAHPQGVITIEAASGAGKTRLLQELSLRAWPSGALVLQAAAPGVAAQSSPLLQQLGDSLVEQLGREAIDALLAPLATHRAALAAMMPTLTESRDEVPSASEDGVNALTALLERLSTTHSPVLILLDDCQDADELALALLSTWINPGVLVVAAFRTPGAHSPPDHDRRWRLGAMDETDIAALLTSMVGPLHANTLRTVTTLAEGNTFLAIEALRGIVEDRRLPSGDGRLTADDSAPVLSLRAGTLLARRLDGLPPATLQLLSLAAVMGRSFQVSRLSALDPRPPQVLFDDLEQARRMGALWTDSRGTYGFTHDRIREAVVERLPPAERRRLHAALAHACAEDPSASPYEVCHHFVEAGDVTAASPWAKTAGEDAHARFALDTAIRHYRIALEGIGPGDLMRRPTLERLGDALTTRGQYEEGDLAYQQALDLCHRPIDIARLLSRRGGRHRRAFNPRGRQFLEDALRRIGHPLPGGQPARVMALLRAMGRQALHTVLPRRYLGRSNGDRDTELLGAEICYELAQTVITAGDIVSALWGAISQLNLTEGHGESEALCMAQAEHVALLSQMPVSCYGRADRYAQRALQQVTRLDGHFIQGAVYGRVGFLRINEGRVAEARALLERGVGCGERSGDSYEWSASMLWSAHAEIFCGDTRRGLARLSAVYDRTLEIGDQLTSSTALAALCWFSGGQVALERVEAEQAVEASSEIVAAQRLRAQGLWKLGQGDLAGAAMLFERADDARSGVRIVHDFGHAWAATVHRLLAASLPVEAAAQRRAHLRKARRAAVAAASALTLMVRPHGLRERAIHALMRGHPHRARALFERSLYLSRQQENRYDEAWTLYERGRAGRWLGWPGADDDLRAGRQMFASMGLDPSPLEQHRLPTPAIPAAPSSVGLADRLAGALEAGRALASALSESAVYEAVHATAVALLRAQHGVVLTSADDGSWTPVAGRRQLELSRSLVESVCTTQQVLTVEEAPAARAQESLLLSSVRSVLAAPVVTRGQVAAVFYVTHDQVSGLFGEEEIALAWFISAIAGAALENARGFDDIRRLSVSLEEEGRRLQTAVEEKRVMLAEIHHRVGNNLQLIASLLRLQARAALTPEIRYVLDDMLRRVHAMAMLGDLMYSSAELDNIPMDVYARSLVDNVARSFGSPQQVRLELTLAPISLGVSLAIPCGLLLNELVSNAFRHAFPDEREGTVSVTLEVHGDDVALRVADDGIGLPSDVDRGTSGLTIVRALAAQLGGTLDWDGARGTSAVLRFSR